MPERRYDDEDDLESIEEKIIEEELAKIEYTISESDAVIDRDDYDEEELDDEWEEDLAQDSWFNTQRGEGHSYDSEEAWQQGLTYTPPHDPPTITSDNPGGLEIGAGFAPSMEETNPDEEKLPARVDNNAFDLQEDVYLALRYNSETMNLADRIKIRVDEGVVTLEGRVESEQDIALIDELITDLEGVAELNNRLEVEDADEWSL